MCSKSEKLTGKEKKRGRRRKKRRKDKGRRKELKKISLKVRLCINVCSLSLNFCFDKF